METSVSTPPISLYDVVLWALRRKGLRTYTHDELCALYASAPEDAFVFTDEAKREIRGTALATRVSDRVVRIRFIAHCGDPATMAQMVSVLNERFPGAKVIAFKRRDKECEFPISELPRLLNLTRAKEN